ncbi:MAG: type VII toxin-antitoxin system MntA family adenylyltransferase antitoxin [Zhaonellaceae bacterium]|nr:nucleotidyltransferase domain-containing protein [Clostridia bacterium]
MKALTAQLQLDDKLAHLPVFFSREPSIQAVFLFGSYGTEAQTPSSDIDFAVLFKTKVSLADELELQGKLSEVLGTDRVDLVNLRKAPLRLQFRAISQGRLLYEKDYVTTCDYVEHVIKYYQDYAIDLAVFYQEYDQSLKEAYSDV